MPRPEIKPVTFPIDLEIFCSSNKRYPWTKICCGTSYPAAMSIAGQYTQWKRRMSFPIRWCTWGHQVAKRSSSSP